MNKVHDVAVLVGSLRKASLNRKLAQALIELAPPSLRLQIIEIGDLPLYNEDIDAGSPPAAYQRFREQVGKAQALLFVTPEYNRSVPAPLKNAIDVGSRPYGQSVFASKPGAVVSVSPGAIGGFGANHHLRQSLTFLNMPVLAQPEAYIGNTGSLFDDAGNLANDGTRDFLANFGKAFEKHIALNMKG